jgi:hypothetical protein
VSVLSEFRSNRIGVRSGCPLVVASSGGPFALRGKCSNPRGRDPHRRGRRWAPDGFIWSAGASDRRVRIRASRSCRGGASKFLCGSPGSKRPSRGADAPQTCGRSAKYERAQGARTEGGLCRAVYSGRLPKITRTRLNRADPNGVKATARSCEKICGRYVRWTL